MTPDEVLEKLKILGINISRPTLTRYENQGLIPRPKRGALGRAGGRWTDYPDGTVEETYAAWSLMHGEYGHDNFRNQFANKKSPYLSPDTIARAKKLHENYKSKPIVEEWKDNENELERSKIKATKEECLNFLKATKRIIGEQESFMSLEDKLMRDAQFAADDIDESFDVFVRSVWKWECVKCGYLLKEKALT